MKIDVDWRLVLLAALALAWWLSRRRSAPEPDPKTPNVMTLPNSLRETA